MELCVVQNCLSYGGLEKVVRFGRHCLRDQADFKRRIWQTPNIQRERDYGESGHISSHSLCSSWSKNRPCEYLLLATLMGLWYRP